MSYTKPQLTTLESAGNAIRSLGAGKGSPYVNDANPGIYHDTATATAMAYEADE